MTSAPVEGRVGVNLGGQGAKSIKLANLRGVAASHEFKNNDTVKVVGYSRTLDGMVGIIDKADSARSARWCLRLSDKSYLSLTSREFAVSQSLMWFTMFSAMDIIY